MREFDVIVIGSGSGSQITRPACNLGLQVAILEKGQLGGTCLNHGCIPSKMLIHPADVLSELQEMNKLNIRGAGLDAYIDKSSLVQRVCQDIDEDSHSIVEMYQKTSNLTLFRGEARFVGDKVLEINGIHITAKWVIIAAGCRAKIPDIPGLDGTPYLTYKEVLRMQSTPSSMIIIGGGYIACELGYFLGKSGTKVEFLVRNHMLAAEDPDIRKEFERVFREHHQVHFGAIPERVTFQDNCFQVDYRVDGKMHSIRAESLFVATGVVPNSDTLNVKACGVQIDSNGFIKVDRFLRTNVHGVYAFGDIIGRDLFKHTANYQGKYLFKSLFEKHVNDGIVYPPIPHAVFSNPQIGGVGLTEPQANDTYGKENVIVGMVDYDEVAMGNAMVVDHGIAKVIFEKESRKLVGAHIVGKEASNLIHMCIAFMKMGATIDDMMDTIYIHPALAELIRNATWKAKKNWK
jgi:dihydrolipoamide dehydrogenase